MRPDDDQFHARHAALLREPAASREGAEPLPPWLAFLFLGLVFLAAGYLFYNSGGFQSTVFNPAISSDGADSAQEGAASDPMVVGRKVYLQNCAICHQPSGQGLAGQFPPLAGSEWVLAKEPHGDNSIVAIVLHGFQGQVTVRGQQFNNIMAPWGPVLKDGQIAAVLTYIRNEWGNQAPPITPEFVAKIRQDSASRKDAWTMKDLLALPREMDQPTPTPTPGPSGTNAPVPDDHSSSPRAQPGG